MSGHHHHHHDHSGPIAIGATATRVVIGLLTVIGVITLLGAIMLWPDRQNIAIPLPMQTAGGGAVETEAGTVVAADVGFCGSASIGKVFADQPEPPRNNNYECERILIDIETGPHEGNRTLLELSPGPGQPSLVAGDEIRIVRQTDPYGTPMYSFDDYSRGFPLALIGLAFVIVVIVVARWRGLRALIGLGFAFAVLVMFLLPALLDGKPAIPVALVAGSLILYSVLYLAHGVNLRTSSALLGTLTSMVVAAVLSWLAIEMTRLTGLSEEQNTNVATYIQNVSITGLLLAGFIIGSLGVLNDVTITQASAAFELAELDKGASRREIFAAAMRVGRDHIASTVYTLVLAYAGGALPLLLLFSVAGRSIRDVLVGDAVAIEIARSSVGGIALALSVPLTTGIAVLLARPFGGAAAGPEAAVVDGPKVGAAAATGPRHGRPASGSSGSGERGPVRRRAGAGATGQPGDAEAGSGGLRSAERGGATGRPGAGGTTGRRPAGAGRPGESGRPPRRPAERPSAESGSDEGRPGESAAYESGSRRQGSHEQDSRDQGLREQGSHEQGAHRHGAHRQGSDDHGSRRQGPPDHGSHDQGPAAPSSYGGAFSEPDPRSYEQDSYGQGGYGRGSYSDAFTEPDPGSYEPGTYGRATPDSEPGSYEPSSYEQGWSERNPRGRGPGADRPRH